MDGTPVNAHTGHRPAPDELGALLAEHPALRGATVTVEADGRLVARVVPNGTPPGPAPGGDAEAEYLREWEGIYDALYEELRADDPDTGFTGWVSSYSGAPIELPQMREWRAATVRRIAESEPRRILEIGAGSGLLLSALAPRCVAYWGTDVSGPAVDRLRELAPAGAESTGRVVLRQQAAHETDGLPEGFFDTVVLNSVVQYFPGARYLTETLQRVFRLLAPGGRVFLGDVRDLRLHRCFGTAVRLARADRAADAATLRGRVARDRAMEKELLIDPDFFTTLSPAIPRLREVDIQIKRGRYHNELNRYRYDVVLWADSGPDAAAARRTHLRWGADVTDLAGLRAVLGARERPATVLTGVANSRLTGEHAAMVALDSGVVVPYPPRASGVDPEDLYELGESLGYRVLATWSGARPAEDIDVLFSPGPAIAPYVATGSDRPLTNDPLAVRDASELVSELRRFVRRRMPDQPSPTIVVEGR